MRQIKLKPSLAFLTNLFDYIFVICIVLDCRSLYGRTTVTPGWFGYITTLGLAAGLFGKIFFKSRIALKKHAQTALLGYSMFFVSFLLFCTAHAFSNASVMFLIKLTLTFIYYILDTENNDLPKLLLKYKNIICMIAVVSLFFWIFGSMLSIIKPTGYVYSDWTGNAGLSRCPSYYFIYFETQDSDVSGVLASKLVRNSAIFTEAPMSSFHFVLALMIETYINPHTNRRLQILLILASVSTLSVTGFCLLILMFMIWLKDTNRKYFFILFPLITSFFLIGAMIVFHLMQAKLDSKSGLIRIDDFKVCFQAWLTHPLFGCDIGNSEYIRSFMGAWRTYNTGLSNSPGQILAQGGLFLFTIYMSCIFFGIRNSRLHKQKKYFYFCLLFSLIFCITVVPYNLITMIIMIWMSQGTSGRTQHFLDKFVNLPFYRNLEGKHQHAKTKIS